MKGVGAIEASIILHAGGIWVLCVLIIGHVYWTVNFSAQAWTASEPVWTKLARMAFILVTPVVGFYTVEALRHYDMPPWDRPKVSLVRLILPTITLSWFICSAVSGAMRPDMEGHRFIGGLTTFLQMSGFYLAFYLPHHILARVVNISHHGPITSLVQLLPVSLIAAVAVIAG